MPLNTIPDLNDRERPQPVYCNKNEWSLVIVCPAGEIPGHGAVTDAFR